MVGRDFANQADPLKGNSMQRPIRRGVLVLATLAVLAVPIAVNAAGGFTDVSDDNIFKNDIQWMADNGITKGCNPPTNDKFCPSDVVTRETMSAFMHRLGVNQVVDAGTVQGYTAAELMTGVPGPVGPEGPAGPSNVGYATMAMVTSVVGADGVVLEKQITLPWAGFAVVSGQVSFGSTAPNAYDNFSCGLSEGPDSTYTIDGTWRFPTLDYLSNPYPTCDTQTVLQLDDGTHIVRLTVQDAETTTYIDSGNLVINVFRFMPVP